MKPSKGTAHLAGVLYLLMGITGFYNLMIAPRALVSGDAAATARNIAGSELVYRLGIMSGLAADILFVLLGVTLYALLKEVSRDQARLMVAVILVEVILGVAGLTFQAAPLALLADPGSLSAFTKPQLDTLSLVFLRLYSLGIRLGMAFWGLWLFPFGLLVLKSGWFPKVLGVLLIAGGVAYLVVSVTGIVFPAREQAVNQVMLPFYSAGELLMILWLLVKGAKVPPLEPAAAA